MKTYFISIIILLISLNVSAQKEDRKERIKALKIAFITERLELTEKEAQEFWPLYNTFEDENEKLRRESNIKKNGEDFESLTETDAKTMLQNIISNEEKKSKLRKDFVNDLLKVLPAKKIILLKVTEDAFNRRLLEEMRKRKEGNRRNIP